MSQVASHLVILGPQGAGKGTQAEALGRILNAAHIASGDLIRNEIRKGSERGKRVMSYTASGKLVPDSLILDLVSDALGRSPSWILDGFPRTAAQAQALEEMLEARSLHLDAVIALEAPDDVLVERISGRIESQSTGNDYHIRFNPPPASDPGPFVRRFDDTPDAIAQRLAIYHTATEPLESYYAQRGLLIRIDASPPVKVVTAAILTALNTAGRDPSGSSERMSTFESSGTA